MAGKQVAATPQRDDDEDDDDDEDMEVDEDDDKFRMAIIGATDVGKSSLINSFMQIPDSSHPGAARTSQRGSGNHGCTLSCDSYECKIAKRDCSLLDSIGVGTTLTDAKHGGLLAELEALKRTGASFHVILFCVKGTDNAEGLAATVKKILEISFLKGKKSQM